MSLKYEPSSELFHSSAKELFLDRDGTTLSLRIFRVIRRGAPGEERAWAQRREWLRLVLVVWRVLAAAGSPPT